MISAFPSARFFKNSWEIEEVENTTGRTKLKIRDRLLVSYDKFLLCGASGIALTTNTVAILDTITILITSIWARCIARLS